MQYHLSMKQAMQEQLGESSSLDPRASRLFERALRAGRGRKWVRQEPTPLPQLDPHAITITQRYHLGAQTVAIGAIVGTVNRSGDFDAAFHPIGRASENRWLRVATAFLRGAALPPVELIRVGEAFYVVDGHHRISVARMLGHAYLDAVVTVWDVA